jgi:DNA repair exonuclease SbcCD ATPase subunit
MILKLQLPAINQEMDKILSNHFDFKITLETDTASNVMDVFIEDSTGKRVIEVASGMEKMVTSIAIAPCRSCRARR